MSKALVRKERTELEKSFNDLMDIIHVFVTQPEKKTVSLTKKKLPTS